MARGPVPTSRTRRLEYAIAPRLRRGMTYRAIARELRTTAHVVEYTARRMGIRRAPGRPRKGEPSLIPSMVPPPARW